MNKAGKIFILLLPILGLLVTFAPARAVSPTLTQSAMHYCGGEANNSCSVTLGAASAPGSVLVVSWQLYAWMAGWNPYCNSTSDGQNTYTTATLVSTSPFKASDTTYSTPCLSYATNFYTAGPLTITVSSPAGSGASGGNTNCHSVCDISVWVGEFAGVGISSSSFALGSIALSTSISSNPNHATFSGNTVLVASIVMNTPDSSPGTWTAGAGYTAVGGSGVRGFCGQFAAPAANGCTEYALSGVASPTMFPATYTVADDFADIGIALFGAPFPIVFTTQVVACTFTTLQCWWYPMLFLGMYLGFFIAPAMVFKFSEKGFAYFTLAGATYASLIEISLGTMNATVPIMFLVINVAYSFRLDRIVGGLITR